MEPKPVTLYLDLSTISRLLVLLLWNSELRLRDVADLDPVLLVSGIAGSILNSKSKKFGFETRVWVRILLADLEFKKKLFSIYNPKTGLCCLGVSKFGPSSIAVVACRGLVTDFTPASTGGYNATFVSDILAEPKGMISEP
ncbi:phospholipase A(1) LCAT3-like [Forsythia ovata]|uniref:Phospholipase A(1) LCAT3-like n=1 Tax=Forsythia ovata TaxID=205694 RepID=A0ABD1WHX9_9LAMI